jgi:chromosome segregation ATPase
MVVELALETKDQLLAWQEFKRNQTALSDIKDTRDSLRELSNNLELFEQQYERIKRRLDKEHVIGIQEFCDELSSNSIDSHDDFATKRRQVLEINKISDKVSELHQSLRAAWHLYAQQQLRPRNDLYELVKHLPEVYRQRAHIEKVLTDLNRQKESVPSDDKELLSFDTNLERLDSGLDRLSGLSPSIQLFLDQVRKGNFTLADLTEEILDWCQQDDRGQAFRVTFGS